MYNWTTGISIVCMTCVLDICSKASDLIILRLVEGKPIHNNINQYNKLVFQLIWLWKLSIQLTACLYVACLCFCRWCVMKMAQGDMALCILRLRRQPSVPLRKWMACCSMTAKCKCVFFKPLRGDSLKKFIHLRLMSSMDSGTLKVM